MSEILFERKVADDVIIEKAREVLAVGGIIVIPTDTIPGIGCLANNHDAVRKLFVLKDRPENLPIPVIIADTTDIQKYAKVVPKTFYKLSDRYWPGPLTIILESNKKIDKLVGGGLSTIGFRVPDNPLLRSIVREVGAPLALTSANPHNLAPSGEHQKLLTWWKNEVELIVLGKSTVSGVASAVVDLTATPPGILREGIINTEELEALLV
jgi:L-threonylcarbamoyladenylate synthase